ncbi:Decaprenyl diphosphate synthase [hydrothermal vent metagenome]|uniref:Decaprenyl diphosphate synthase n=1 Tax=hydrothermal vent metagenome TaxID=652676 RepID=A0A3B0T0H4_9ZZZZ
MSQAVKVSSLSGADDNPASRLSVLVAEDMARVNDLVNKRMQSPVGMIPDLAAHLVDAGGKRLRPMITLATSAILGYRGDHHIRLATAVEFIHSATLLHDDIVDGSKLRRGKAVANRLWGNSASVLVGDFLFAQSFSLMVETGHLPVLGILARASSVIAEGEVHQLSVIGNIDLPIEEYLAIIEAKTAELFAAAARVSAVVAKRPLEEELALDQYGRCLGLAFQLVDDALDYAGDERNLGKQAGDDFREAKVTLPLAFAYQNSNADDKKWWQQILDADLRSDADLDMARQKINQHQGIEQTLLRAKAYTKQAKTALSGFAPSEIRDCLMDLSDYVITRRF